MNLKTSLITACSLIGPLCADEAAKPSGPFDASWESLKTYRCPEWFRDAKFGIWSHWGPQAVPKQGDWYARKMYQEGTREYEHHLKTRGHPSEHGYREIIDAWKAEKWDPDRLMSLYQKAGARYFVSMACHHDNFDLWDSRHHPWNAVRMGPKRDIVGEWQAAAKRHGLRFGVSEHMAASFTWWQVSHGSDKKGPKAGVPYDGADPAVRDLHHWPAAAGDNGWYSADPRWHALWSRRVGDLVQRYKPDLLYSDGGLPFGETGRRLVADFYNLTATRDGRTDGVYNCKQHHGHSENNQYVDGTCVRDMERGVLDGVQPLPWQTDTSIGDWYYNEHWKYRPVSWTIHMLVDIVSKNGNLLINVVQRPDGSLDPEVERQLEELAVWNAAQGEAIFGTRPWQVYGEGRVKPKGGSFNEDFTYSARDIRFTTRKGVLYAIALGWPEDRRLLIRSLARPEGSEANRIGKVSLLGYDGPLRWKSTAKGLEVELPEKPVSPYTVALAVSGEDLKAMPLGEERIEASADGSFDLPAVAAILHGEALQCESRGQGQNIGFWDKGGDWVSWKVEIAKPGTYQVTARAATAHAGASFVVEAGDQKLAVTGLQAGGWDHFGDLKAGKLRFPDPGAFEIRVKAADVNAWKAINLAGLKLAPVP